MAAFLSLTEPLEPFAVNEKRGITCPFPSVQIYSDVPSRVWWTRWGPTTSSQTPPRLIAAGSAEVVNRPVWARVLIIEAQAAGNIQVSPVVSIQVDGASFPELLKPPSC